MVVIDKYKSTTLVDYVKKYMQDEEKRLSILHAN